MKRKRLTNFILSGVMLFSIPLGLSDNNLFTSVSISTSAATSADFSISQNGIEFICAREGFSQYCYYDGAQSSIGYGTKCGTAPHASGLHSITKEAAMTAMKNEINSSYVPNVKRQTAGITMNQNQFDALVSFTYNTGGGTTMIKNSPLVKYLRGELTDAQARLQFSNYIVTNSATGTVDQGLINRRNKEADLFFSTLPKLDSPVLAINRSTGTPNDTISITWDAVPYADSYWLHIYRNGEDYVNQTLNQELSYSSSYPAGKYTAYVVSCNSQEEALSSVDFSIYNSAPEKPNPKISKESYSVNETVDITWDATKDTDIYWLHIYRNGEDYVNQSINQDLSYSKKYPVGEYTAYIVSCNGIGETLSNVSFKVYDSTPSQPNPKISKKTYSVNETVDITWDATKDTDIYWLHIYRNGEDYVNQSINQDLSYSKKYPVGEYTAYIVSCNGIGETLSSVSFTVINELNISFNANEGVCSTTGKSVFYGGTYGTLPTPSRTGYTFDGWYTEKTGGTKITADTKVTVTENQTLYAHWVDNEAPVINSIDVANLTMDGFSLVIKATDTAGIKNVNVDAYTWRGFEADGKTLTATKSGDSWICDINISDFNGSHGAYYCVVRVIDVNGNTTSSDTKEVKVATFTCTFDANGGTVEQQQKVLVYGDRYGRITNLPTPVCEGKIFQGWYTEKTAGVKVTDDMIFNGTKDQTLYARWRVKGDIDTDDKIGVTDIITVQKYLHRNNEFTKEQYEIADMNGDGKVNVIDLALMKRQLLQK